MMAQPGFDLSQGPPLTFGKTDSAHCDRLTLAGI